MNTNFTTLSSSKDSLEWKFILMLQCIPCIPEAPRTQSRSHESSLLLIVRWPYVHSRAERRGCYLQCSCSKYSLCLFWSKRELGGSQRRGLGKLFLTMPEEVGSGENALSSEHAPTQCTHGKNQVQVAALSSWCVAEAPYRLQVLVQVNLTETSSLHKVPPWGNCSSSSVPANHLCYGKMNFDESACLKKLIIVQQELMPGADLNQVMTYGCQSKIRPQPA